MCKPCGSYCCESEEDYGCGCEHCPEEACWPEQLSWFDLGVQQAQRVNRKPPRKIEIVGSI